MSRSEQEYKTSDDELSGIKKRFKSVISLIENNREVLDRINVNLENYSLNHYKANVDKAPDTDEIVVLYQNMNTDLIGLLQQISSNMGQAHIAAKNVRGFEDFYLELGQTLAANVDYFTIVLPEKLAIENKLNYYLALLPAEGTVGSKKTVLRTKLQEDVSLLRNASHIEDVVAVIARVQSAFKAFVSAVDIRNGEAIGTENTKPTIDKKFWGGVDGTAIKIRNHYKGKDGGEQFFEEKKARLSQPDVAPVLKR